LLYGLFAVAAYVIKNAVEEKKREHRLLRYPPFFNLSEFYQVAMIILLPPQIRNL